MVINRQNRVRVAPQRLEHFLVRVQRTLRLPRGSATVCLVTDSQIAKWNRAYRGKSKPTDVLSFPVAKEASANGNRRAKVTHARYPLAERASAFYLGDIAIAPAVARRNALPAGRSLEHELRVLILHGVLHLLGYDHETDNGEMERLELCLRRRLGIG
ncbi:MAG TPA: rRNA maturation RNase YbeY [Candidatus Acidoferrales bacterium]|nr:rRNA maturation RNase YbeY [Candidatus Acidoferrales bacterium]